MLDIIIKIKISDGDMPGNKIVTTAQSYNYLIQLARLRSLSLNLLGRIK